MSSYCQHSVCLQLDHSSYHLFPHAHVNDQDVLGAKSSTHSMTVCANKSQFALKHVLGNRTYGLVSVSDPFVLRWNLNAEITSFLTMTPVHAIQNVHGWKTNAAKSRAMLLTMTTVDVWNSVQTWIVTIMACSRTSITVNACPITYVLGWKTNAGLARLLTGTNVHAI